ncbi:MAG TPA: hypothetical protein VMT47_13135, partial [Polyangia bacterium]|nr:hypothetical protein [Polyangia bacterium]
MACASLLVVLSVGCSSSGPAHTGTSAGDGGASGNGGASVGSSGETGSAGSVGTAGAGPAGTGGGSGGMSVAGVGGSGGSPGGNDASVNDARADVPPIGDASGGNSWTGTWTAAPDGTCSAATGQTVRSIVHTSIGGNAARVRISNARGNGPLHISNVHLA